MQPPTNHGVARILRRTRRDIRKVLHVAQERSSGSVSRNALFRYHVVFTNARGGVQELRFRGKISTPQEWYLLKLLHSRRQGFRVPKPLHYDTKTGFLLYEELWGDTLRNFPFARRASELPALFRALAEELTRLHRMPQHALSRVPERTPDGPEELFRCLARRHGAIMQRFALPKASPPKTPKRLVHGDLQASNILLTLPDAHLGLIDFSRSHRGHPVEDVASFFVHTRLMLHGVIPARQRDEALQAFLTRYRRRARLNDRPFHAAFAYYAVRAFAETLGTTLDLVPSAHADRQRLLALFAEEHRMLVRISQTHG